MGPWITSIFDVPRAALEWDAWTVDLFFLVPRGARVEVDPHRAGEGCAFILFLCFLNT
jgi:hypothetical protein